MKTSELTGNALDWAVAKCEGLTGILAPVNYCGKWEHGGPIIEREGLTIIHQQTRWAAQTDDDLFAYGPTPLIAAMRCYVASRLGDDVDVPWGTDH